jgi:trk system potassium uptake protein TrkA
MEAVVHGDSRTSKLVGHAVGEIVLPEGVTIGAVARRDQVLMAHHDIVIEAEDHVILFVPSKSLIPKVEKLFQTA